MTKTPSRGAKFKAEVLAVWSFRPDEMILLDETAATIDLIDSLAATDHVEIRQQRHLLSKLMGQLGLQNDGAKHETVSGPAVRGRRAAEQRWSRANA